MSKKASKKQASNKRDTRFKKGNKVGPRFPPGTSGNPKGRPHKDVCITSQVRIALDVIPSLLPNGKKNTRKLTWAKIIAVRLVTEAGGEGGIEFIKTALDRIEGKVPETLRHGLDEYSPELVDLIRDRFKK